jgi:hypothetical protein
MRTAVFADRGADVYVSLAAVASAAAAAARILEDMGVLKELMDNNEAHFADAGGFVSPMGISYVGASKEKLGEAACCAVKRINLDNRIAKKAKSAGADLKEGFEVGVI